MDVEEGDAAIGGSSRAYVQGASSALDLLAREPLRCTLLVVTTREADVIGWVTKGLTNKAIASQLQISSRTVQKHMERMFRKFGVRSHTELVTRVYIATLQHYKSC